MNWTATFEPMFFMPFITGLLVAAVLPVLGMYLRLREEWLAALAFAQLAAAGSLAAAIAGAPVLVGGLALATASVGVMAAFTLVFVPTMIAYQWGRSWRQSLVIAVVVGLVAYAVAFQVALVQDQPFGPILVVTMVCAAAGAWLVRKLAYRPSGKAPARC